MLSLTTPTLLHYLSESRMGNKGKYIDDCSRSARSPRFGNKGKSVDGLPDCGFATLRNDPYLLGK